MKVTFISWCGGYISLILFFLFGNDPTSISWLYALLFFIVLDFVAGIHDAVKKKTFCYSILLDGLWRKLLTIAIVAMAHVIDIIGIVDGIANMQKIVTGFLIGYEGISILKFIKIAGVSIPDILIKNINKIIGKSDGET